MSYVIDDRRIKCKCCYFNVYDSRPKENSIDHGLLLRATMINRFQLLQGLHRYYVVYMAVTR